MPPTSSDEVRAAPKWLEEIRAQYRTNHCAIHAECTHFCRNLAADSDCGPHQCGLTQAPLSAVESQQICVDYAV